jgi:outer membrane lipase/esterase
VPNQYTGFSLVPTYPYPTRQFTPAVPFDRYTNGFVWAESFAAGLGLTALPSLFPGIPNVAPPGTNFAFAGARTGPAGSGFPFSLTDQALFFAAGLQGQPAPSSALYVVAGGGNNARDTVTDLIGAALGGATPAQLEQLIDAAALAYALDIQGILTLLQQLGATSIVVWNAPDAGTAPAILAGAPFFDPLFQALLGETFAGTATDVSERMNEALTKVLGQFAGVRLFDLFGLVDDVVAHPSKYSLLNVDAPCAALPLVPDPSNPSAPFCDPSKFLFWDGIHPTSAGHLIIGDAMLALVPEPSSIALLLIAMLGSLVVSHRRIRVRPDPVARQQLPKNGT